MNNSHNTRTCDQCIRLDEALMRKVATREVSLSHLALLSDQAKEAWLREIDTLLAVPRTPPLAPDAIAYYEAFKLALNPQASA